MQQHQANINNNSPHSSPTPNASDVVLFPDRLQASASIELSEAGHEGHSSERKRKAKPDLRPGLRMLFSKPVWQQELKRKWQRVAPKVIWSLIVQEKWTIVISAVFAGARQLLAKRTEVCQCSYCAAANTLRGQSRRRVRTHSDAAGPVWYRTGFRVPRAGTWRQGPSLIWVTSLSTFVLTHFSACAYECP